MAVGSSDSPSPPTMAARGTPSRATIHGIRHTLRPLPPPAGCDSCHRRRSLAVTGHLMHPRRVGCDPQLCHREHRSYVSLPPRTAQTVCSAGREGGSMLPRSGRGRGLAAWLFAPHQQPHTHPSRQMLPPSTRAYRGQPPPHPATGDHRRRVSPPHCQRRCCRPLTPEIAVAATLPPPIALAAADAASVPQRRLPLALIGCRTVYIHVSIPVPAGRRALYPCQLPAMAHPTPRVARRKGVVGLAVGVPDPAVCF